MKIVPVEKTRIDSDYKVIVEVTYGDADADARFEARVNKSVDEDPKMVWLFKEAFEGVDNIESGYDKEMYAEEYFNPMGSMLFEGNFDTEGVFERMEKNYEVLVEECDGDKEALEQEYPYGKVTMNDLLKFEKLVTWTGYISTEHEQCGEGSVTDIKLLDGNDQEMRFKY